MSIHIKTAYLDDDADIEFGTYHDGSTALTLFSEEEGRLSRPTVCLLDQGLIPEPGNVFVKSWAESAGMVKGLMDAGVIGPPVKSIPVGPYGVLAYECPLLVKP